MESRTPATVTTVEALRDQLDRYRAKGYAEALGELEIGLDAVAAPVFDSTGDVVAAVGLSGPSDRVRHQLPQLGALLTSQAEALSRVLGHQKRKDGAA
jgi:DNA-binding IclR family transcriptional regulator